MPTPPRPPATPGPPGRRRAARGAGRPRGADASYVAQLGATLRQRDPLALRAFLAASARRFGNEAEAAAIEARSPSEMALIMHQMIVARPDLRDLHADSQRWLRRHGLDPDVTGESRRN